MNEEMGTTVWKSEAELNKELIYRIMSLRAAENSFWTYRKHDDGLSSAVMRADEPGVKAILLELPVDPRTLTLPPLPKDGKQ